MIPLGTSPDPRASELLESAPPRFSTLAEMTIEETFTMSPTNALYRLSGAGPLAQAERDTASPMLSAEMANEKYGVADLRFDNPVNERTAQLLWTEKRAEMLRKETLARGPDGFWNAIWLLSATREGKAASSLSWRPTGRNFPFRFHPFF